MDLERRLDQVTGRQTISENDLIVTPLYRRQEFEADRWAASATGRGAELADTLLYLEGLNEMRLEKAPRWLRWIVGHPINSQRVALLRAHRHT